MSFNRVKETVSAGVESPDGQYLLLKKNPSNGYQGSWELPGGSIENGESHEDAIKRELEEELGVSEQDLEVDHYGCDLFGNGFGDYKLQMYKLEWPEDQDIELSEEHEEYRWCDEEEFLELVREENVLETVEPELRYMDAF